METSELFELDEVVAIELDATELDVTEDALDTIEEELDTTAAQTLPVIVGFSATVPFLSP